MDTKLQTFLCLCEMMNYRKTAEFCHLTQPAVTKQIQSLEKLYDVKLFSYDGKKLQKTKECLILEQYCKSLKYNYNEIVKTLKKPEINTINIGATKSIGEKMLSSFATNVMHKENNQLNIVVDNTENLLKQLDNASLDFTLLEGNFDKNKYSHKVFKIEPYVGVCAKEHPFANKIVPVETVLNETLITREKGSGTRNILERELENFGYSISSFKNVHSFGTFSIIAELISKNCGIGFAYKSLLENTDLGLFYVKNFIKEHEINIVYLKGAQVQKYIDIFFK